MRVLVVSLSRLFHPFRENQLTMRSTTTRMTRLLLVIGLMAGASPAFAQFNLPIPKVLPDSIVMAEDVQTRFVDIHGGGNATRAWITATENNQAAYNDAIEAFCKAESYTVAPCKAALTPAALAARFAWDPN